jgi:catechol 2,3-dioxygenase-like lactoylglutathione lyase family enzyme
MRAKGRLQLVLVGVAALSACVSHEAGRLEPAARHSFTAPIEGVDHVLLWTRNIDEDLATLRDKLGFRIGPRFAFPDHVANRVVYFRDQSFLELLHFTVPLQEVSAESLAGMEFLAERDGSVGFGIRVLSLEARAASLASRGVAMAEPTAAASDPDGPGGPAPPEQNPFRTLGFRESPLPGLQPFFVSYPPWPTETPEFRPMWEATTTHPNTAERLSAVWIIGPDPAASHAALRTLGFAPGRRVLMRQIGATSTIYLGGRSAVVVVEPRGPGLAADALRMRGAHVLGISIAVADLEAAATAAKRGYADTSAPYDGAFGRSVLAPAQPDLGVLVEFHNSP